jgi:hypothetical protein
MKGSKMIWMTMPLGEHRFLSGFLDSNMKKHWLKTDRVKVISPLAAQMKMHRKFTNSSTKTDKVLSTDHHQVQPLIWNMPPNSKGGHEYTVISTVCAIAGAAIFSH